MHLLISQIRRLLPLLYVLALPPLSAEVAQSAGWRGDGSGSSPGSRPPVDWAKDRNVVWSAEIEDGFSSPVAAGGKIFLTADPDKLICIDQAKGTILWEKANGADDPMMPLWYPTCCM